MGDLFPGDQFTSLGQHNPRQQQQQDHQQMSLNQMQISDLALARGNLNMQKELKNEKLNNSGVLSNDKSGIQMVQNCPIAKLSDIQ